jgi:hypothetical protein
MDNLGICGTGEDFPKRGQGCQLQRRNHDIEGFDSFDSIVTAVQANDILASASSKENFFAMSFLRSSFFKFSSCIIPA